MLDLLIRHPYLSTSLLLLLPTLYTYISIFRENRSIRRLGSRAPVVLAYIPFSFDIVIRSLATAYTNRDLDFWTWLFSWSPHRHSPTVEASLGSQRYIFTADPENIKAVLATQFSDYGKGEPFHRDWEDFLGDSIFTTDGELWQRNRGLIRPQFLKSRVRDLEVFERHVQRLLGKLGGRGEAVEVKELFFCFTLDTATDYLLGKSVDSLDDPATEFAAAFAEVQRVQNAISRVGTFKYLLPKGSFRRGLKVLNAFVEPFIESVLRMNINDLKEQDGKSFMHALGAMGIRDRKVIRDQVVAILLAGRDTTAGALSFTFQELSSHPEIVQKLRREVLKTVGSAEAPTYEDLKNMPYLQHCMNETLRLYPGVPYNVRLALHDTTLPTGGGDDGMQPIGILKDTPVAYSAILMQRRADLYPPPSANFAAVLEYSPERWENWTPKPWQYIPFNGGPRICIGQQFALTEMAYTIVRIFQRFERVDKYWAEKDLGLKSEIVIAPLSAVKVGFWEAKS